MSQPVPVEGSRIVLTAVEFDVLWERLGLGPTPVVLRLASPGRTWPERREIVAGGWQALRERKLVGPDGPDPGVVRLMRLLARPSRQVEVRAWCGREVRAVAAGTFDAEVLAVRQDATVVLRPCNSLAGAVMGVLPGMPRGRGRAATLPADVLTAALAAAGESGLRSALRRRGVPGEDAGLLDRMLDRAERRAQFVALAADRWGVLRRLRQVVTVLDGATGRYLLTRTTGEDGVEWATVSPADDRRLRHRLGELLADAATAARESG